MTTAEALRAGGYQGVITLVGDEAELPYDRPPLSKEILKGEWEPDRLALCGQTDIDALDLDLLLGVGATGLDLAARPLLLADGTQLPYSGERAGRDGRINSFPQDVTDSDGIRPGERTSDRIPPVWISGPANQRDSWTS